MSSIQGPLTLRNVYPTGQTFNFDPQNGSPSGPVGEGTVIPLGGVLDSAADAGGELTGQDNNNNTVVVVSFDDIEPAAIEVDWSVVLSVDEYYNDPGFTYTIGMDDGTGGVVTHTIRG